jgi:hypothetical protein
VAVVRSNLSENGGGVGDRLHTGGNPDEFAVLLDAAGFRLDRTGAPDRPGERRARQGAHG